LHDTSFIWYGKKWVKSKTEGEREREGTCKESEVECGRERVAAWVISLTVGQVFMRV
jgi:hypothetical protein